MAASSLRHRALTTSVIVSSRPLVLVLGLVWAGAQMGCQPDTRMSLRTFLALEAAAGRLDQPGPATQPAAPVLEPWTPGPYRVGPGDVLHVTISGLEAVGIPGSHTLRINQKGQVSLPTVGYVAVGGLTLDEVETTVQAAYSPKYIKETQVTAEVAVYRPVEVIVLGEVRGPATVELRRDRSSVLQAILEAGGPTELADDRVTLIPSSAPDSPIVFDLNRREDLVRAARVGVLRPSDVLVVERQSNDFVYMQGLINAPGPVPLPRGSRISALQAIGAAGGTLLAFAPREATLRRTKPDGEVIRVRLDLDRMLAGQDPDLTLAAGDMLTVPHTLSTRFEEFLARTFIFRFGMDTTYSPWTYYYFKKDRETRVTGGDEGFFATFGRQLSTTDLTPLLPTPQAGVP